ncbi:MAG TPA: Coenzyme F420 hydrogenase/dehydrogenase, beta subunit C-terminal domain [Acidimicrobiia bacterium]|nr:Coenzyme F420 hydrogenase/dehydrogenase, beta subunit C-terminal domain [Acidimicrobiia bacterium]
MALDRHLDDSTTQITVVIVTYNSADVIADLLLSLPDGFEGANRAEWRCYVCADHTGEFADVAVGDPWYRPIPPDEPGRSRVVVRTERGRQLVNAAISSDSLRLERVSSNILPASQPNLLKAEGATWGRTVATRMVGVASPRYRNFRLLPIWWRHLSGLEKTRSILGTFKRVITKRLYRRASRGNQALDRKVPL